jgi:hypothetical protein
MLGGISLAFPSLARDRSHCSLGDQDFHLLLHSQFLLTRLSNVPAATLDIGLLFATAPGLCLAWSIIRPRRD